MVDKIYQGRELRTPDIAECAKFVEGVAVQLFIARTRVTDTTIREWLTENRPGTATTRQEFEEAVRRFLITRWGI